MKLYRKHAKMPWGGTGTILCDQNGDTIEGIHSIDQRDDPDGDGLVTVKIYARYVPWLKKKNKKKKGVDCRPMLIFHDNGCVERIHNGVQELYDTDGELRATVGLW